MRLLNWWYRVTEGASKKLEDTWPLWIMGFIGGSMVILGFVVLLRGW